MTSLPEIIAVVLGIIAVYLSTKQHVWTYPLGIISVFIYIFIFFEVKLYADMGLQVFFIVLQVYGWYEWLYGGKNKTELHVSKILLREIYYTIIFVIVATAVIGYTLHKLTDASLPYVDSFLAVLSMAGQWMMAKKYLESWHVWIAVNIGQSVCTDLKGCILQCSYMPCTLVLHYLDFVIGKTISVKGNQ
jgi:nicotinamide mononucleotide transporter